MDRRNFIGASVAVAAALQGTGALAQVVAGSSGRPSVSGPTTNGRRPNALGSFPGDLAALGYVENEYFLEGTATTYNPVGELGPDGLWDVQPTDQRPYRTRIIVQTPADPADFNGTVIVEWINVSPGFDNMIVPAVELYNGFAFVGVGAQYVGIHGFDFAPENERLGLIQWDPDRYGSLTHPGDAYSFDIFSQAARALRGQADGVDPMGGLRTRNIIATGASQSAGRLRTYINAIHPRDQVFDGYLPFLDYGNGVNFSNELYHGGRPREELTRIFRRAPVKYRDDLNVPILIVNSEQEALSFRGANGFLLQPDSDKIRTWEVAGAPHSAELPNDQVTRAAYGVRDGLNNRENRPANQAPGSRVTSFYSTLAGYYHVHNWVNGGPPPPMQPLLRFREGGSAPELIRDDMGIGTGGIRLPEVEVPIAMNTGLSNDPTSGRNSGLRREFDAATLNRLYPSHDNYVERVTHVAQHAERTGAILTSRALQYIAEAQAALVPPG